MVDQSRNTGDKPSRVQSDASAWTLRQRLYRVIFETDTPAGKLFDVVLLWAILLSVLAVCLESVIPIRQHYQRPLLVLEWVFTGLFTVEYILRLSTVNRPLRYAFSFYGLVDLLSILPTYLSLVFPGTQSLLVIRILRLLRVFRVLKLGRYVAESRVLGTAIRNSRRKIIVFLFAVLSIVVVVGAMMYLIEGPERGFTSIPRSMYWAIVTLTTVGYGDITPQTVLGQILSSFLMITGYGIIAIPTGIVTAELTSIGRGIPGSIRTCQACLSEGHEATAQFCRDCGTALPDWNQVATAVPEGTQTTLPESKDSPRQ